MGQKSLRLSWDLDSCQLQWFSVATGPQSKWKIKTLAHADRLLCCICMLVVFQTLTQKQEKSLYWSSSLVVCLSLQVHSVCLKLTMSSMDPPPTGWPEEDEPSPLVFGSDRCFGPEHQGHTSCSLFFGYQAGLWWFAANCQSTVLFCPERGIMEGF